MSGNTEPQKHLKMRRWFLTLCKLVSLRFYQEHPQSFWGYKKKVQSWQKSLHSVLILSLAINRETPRLKQTTWISVFCLFGPQHCIIFFRVLAGDLVSTRMTVCHQLQQSCNSGLWAATPAPQRTGKVGAPSDQRRSICVVILHLPN